MIKLLLKKIMGDNPDKQDTVIRTKYSVFAGILGIICNLFLFAVKLCVGAAMSSIAIISDAFNNLSDTGSSAVTIIGAKLSAKKPDKEHPFGHGRIEYISSLIVSFIILLVGFELLKTSVTKIFHPQQVQMNVVLVIILCISIPVKLWMYSYNKYIGNLTNSGILIATARDCVNDVIATSGVIISSVTGKMLNFPAFDGIIGTIVSFMIMYSGFKISLDTIGLLLGTAPEKELIEAVRSRILSASGVVGVHDLIVHDYGPGRILASVHAEVPDNCNVVEIHEVIDELEHKIERELGIHIVVHMDPITVNCEKTVEMREMVLKTVKEIDERMGIHDFRMTDGESNINLIFDIEAPLDVKDFDSLKNIVAGKLTEIDKRFNCVITVDFLYD